tara:strand:+ start:6122 stop:6349 length:228 start_codon:yes stop_codon:yes gene_type:complete
MVKRYNKYDKEHEKRTERNNKLDKFVELITKDKKPHQIKNELTYYVSVAWDESWTHEKQDVSWLERQTKKEENNG